MNTYHRTIVALAGAMLMLLFINQGHSPDCMQALPFVGSGHRGSSYDVAALFMLALTVLALLKILRRPR